MSSDLLPESVNLFLDDFETSLCLPVLLVMVLCTVQFIFNHIIDIVNMIYQSVKRLMPEQERDKKITDKIGRQKGILNILGIGKPGTMNRILMKRNPLSPVIGTRSQEEEWDYWEEDV